MNLLVIAAGISAASVLFGTVQTWRLDNAKETIDVLEAEVKTLKTAATATNAAIAAAKDAEEEARKNAASFRAALQKELRENAEAKKCLEMEFDTDLSDGLLNYKIPPASSNL